ncbi:MAG: hypothetical protein ACRC62_24645 [Microcoleus sp.]
MLSKSTNQVSGKSIAFIDNKVANDCSTIAGFVPAKEERAIDSRTNRRDNAGETSTTEVILFEVGELSQTITIDVIGDTAAANNETITFTLLNPVAPNSISSEAASIVTATIIDPEILEILSMIQLV